MIPKNLFICIPFFYKLENLKYLKETSKHYNKLADKCYVVILTNSSLKSEINNIKKIFIDNNLNHSVRTPNIIGHPYFLPYLSLEIMKVFYKKSFTHFMLIEDDILITKKNMEYWMRSREDISKFDDSFYPSFIRIEKNYKNKFVYSDHKKRYFKFLLPNFKTDNNVYINLPKNYQGMYLYDRKLMDEYLTTDANNPDFGKHHIREKANIALSFFNVKKFFFSRNILLMDNHNLDKDCYIVHLRSNAKTRIPYKKNFLSKIKLIDKNDFSTKSGTIEVDKLFY